MLMFISSTPILPFAKPHDSMCEMSDFSIPHLGIAQANPPTGVRNPM